MTHNLKTSFFALAVAAIVAASCHAAVVDDFSDLNDTANPAWTHLSGLVASSGQAWDASTGAYHLTAPNNGGATPNTGQLGFVGSYVPGTFTDVRVSADFVEPATGAAFGVAARLNGNNNPGGLRGYAYAYEPFTNGGEMVLYRIVAGPSLEDLGSQQVTLDLANKDYTFVLEVIGNQLHGQVFEVGGGMVAEKIGTDSNSLFASGSSGVFGYSAVVAQVPTNFTIDNFSTADIPEPAAGALLACGAAAMAIGRRVGRNRQSAIR
jgi:hypothetical protein